MSRACRGKAESRGAPVSRRILLGWFVLGLASSGVGLGAAPHPAPVSKEFQVKAAFLYNFAKFVEWPRERFASETSPIRIAVVGRNPFGSELENAVRGRKINGRDITVVYVSSAEETRTLSEPVHVVYFTAGEEQCLEHSGKIALAASWLTVGETHRFATHGGVVGFSTVDDKVRFEINARLAHVAGLKISAQLLKLATVVHRGTEEGAR